MFCVWVLTLLNEEKCAISNNCLLCFIKRYVWGKYHLRRSIYCFFSTCLPPTVLHLWRSCALKLACSLCCDTVSESFQMSIDFSLPGRTLAACQPDCGLSVLRWQVTQFLHIILPNHTYSGIHRISEHRKDSLSEFLCEVSWQHPHTVIVWFSIRLSLWFWRQNVKI